MATYASSSRGHGAMSNATRGLPPFNAPAAPVPAQKVPVGALAAGTAVSVGKYKVTIDRFLSEGGFAHVYLATSELPIPAGSPNATRKHVLKRMLAPDTRTVAQIGKEVEVMKLLKDHPRIVNFIEASCTELPNKRGYEIYILMEWCAGGGIIDMMNTRLQNRLTESEILKMFSDTVEAVAHMHYQSPPLIHRDLKVENILLCPPNTFKLCDFGSTVTPLKQIPTAVPEIQALEHEINKSTTLQYRAPELVDVWARKGYDEKIDIWALGVLLYKLCYYTTPFEEQGPLAILNAQYKFPPYPAYSNSIKQLIAGMLVERAANRPNIYQVHEQVSKLRGVAVRLENKYANTASSSARDVKNPSSSVPSLSSAPKLPTGPSVSDIASTISPMRRGRPSKGPAADGSPSLPPVETAPRKVRTGLASMSLNDGDKSTAGFGDSFDDVRATAFASAADRELGESSSLFKDLVSPTASATKSDNDVYAALGNDDSLPLSLGGSATLGTRAREQPPTPSTPAPARTESTTAPTARPASAAPASSAVASARAKFELTGEQATNGRETAQKRSDRGQQTSPWLLELARREHGYGQQTASSPPPLKLQSPVNDVREEDSEAPAPAPAAAAASGQVKQPSRDLLGDDEGGLSGFGSAAAAEVRRSPLLQESTREKFKPVNKRLSMIPPSGSDRHLDAANRFPALEELDAASPEPVSQPPAMAEEKRNGSRATEQWTQLVEKPAADESSDDEDDFSRALPSSAAASKAKAKEEQSASPLPPLTSVRDRAKSPPAIIAPKPQSVKKQAAITSLVSRYEGLSTDSTPKLAEKAEAESPPDEPAAAAAERKAPPAASKKPDALRRASISSSGAPDVKAPKSAEPTTSSTSPPIKSPVISQHQSNASSSSYIPSSPSFNRLPFRPTPPSTASPVRYAARPSNALSSYGASSPPIALPGLASSNHRPMVSGALSRPSPSNVGNANDGAAGEEEERFAGVASMKNRWESLSRSSGPGPGRPAVRKEEGII